MGKEMSRKELKQALTEASKAIKVDESPQKLLREQVRAEQDRVVSEWKDSRQAGLQIEEFDTARHLLLLTLRGHSTATILTGEGGIGKTYLTIETIKQELKSDEWEYRSGFTTPLAFYKYLYAHRDKRVLVVDDVEGLFDNAKSITILKGALWDTNGKRLVYYDTTSEKAEDVPSVFELRSRLIILCNRIPNAGDVNVSALLSRAVAYELRFSHGQKLRIMKRILDSRKGLDRRAKAKVMEIIENETSVATKDFNIRTMERLVAYVRYDPERALALFRATTESDEDAEVAIELMASGLPVTAQATEFCRRTGKSRRTFFRIKRKLKQDTARVPSKTDVTNGSD